MPDRKIAQPAKQAPTQLTLDLSQLSASQVSHFKPASGGGGFDEIFMFFGRIAPDAGSGNNTLTISGLPSNTRVASVWMTEWVEGDNSHVGAAVFTTESVQLEASNNTCRVTFHLDWGSSLPAACQGFFGIFGGDVGSVP